MSKPRDTRHRDLFQPALAGIVDPDHPLVRLAREIDWGFIEGRFASVCRPGVGQPPLPTRLVAGLFILKHMHDLSDEGLCARWIENPYFQLFCGEEHFQHRLPFDRSSLTRWRQRLGVEELAALLQESLSVAHRTGAIAPRDLERVSVDTTVQPKDVAFPTDVRLMHTALVKLVRQAKAEGVVLRQSYLRVAKRAAVMAGRYAHAKQFKRFRAQERFLRTRLGRVIRDIRRKIQDDPARRERFAVPLSRADQIRSQRRGQRGRKLYSLHAPEVECIGKGKARTPYEFGCKVSVATPVTKPKGGQFLLHAQALHGNPFDGHTLAAAINDIQANTGIEVRRIHVDKGYRGHDFANKARVWITGQVRRTTRTIKREMKRRAAIEPVIGHLKQSHRLGRNHLRHRHGDRANALLAAAGYNFALLIRWLKALWRALITHDLLAQPRWLVIPKTATQQIEHP